MKTIAALTLALLSVAPALAQHAAPPMFDRIAPPPTIPGTVPLYDRPLPSDGGSPEIWDSMFGAQPVVRNVSQPTITPFLPTPTKATGAAVVVMPGGGFTLVAMQSEGWAVARWLADHGIAAFVVKYRIKRTPDEEKLVLGSLARDMGGLMTDPEGTMAPLAPPAVADALQALSVVRAGAAKWKIDPKRVGMIGFSAGAMATRLAALSADATKRPAYFGYIYGPMGAVTVPTDAPPMFAALALDDPLMGKQGFGVVESWRKASRPVELHAYERGDHGFGTGKPGTTTTLMLPEFLAWLQGRGIVPAPRESRAPRSR